MTPVITMMREFLELSQALLDDLDTQPNWAMEWMPDQEIVKRFREVLEDLKNQFPEEE